MNNQTIMEQTICLSLPSSLRYLNVLGACLRAVLARAHPFRKDQLALDTIGLAVHEIWVHILEYAYNDQPEQGRIEMTISFDDQKSRLTVDFFDTGRSFDTKMTLQQGERFRNDRLFLAQALMDRVDYQWRDNRNCWHLEKYLNRSHP